MYLVFFLLGKFLSGARAVLCRNIYSGGWILEASLRIVNYLAKTEPASLQLFQVMGYIKVIEYPMFIQVRTNHSSNLFAEKNESVPVV